MVKKTWMYLLEILNVFDQRLQRLFDKYLPQSLTLRYIFGLAIIGLLSIGGHFVIQFSIIKLDQDVKIIRQIENHVSNSEAFYRDVVQLQTFKNEMDTIVHVENIKNKIKNISHDHQVLINGITPKSLFGFSLPNQLQHYKLELANAYNSLRATAAQLENIRYLNKSELLMADPIIVEFIKSENRYRDILEDLNKNIKFNSAKVVKNFKKLELIFLALTLLILVLEGLYIFRPAVQRVNSAIQLRTDFLSRMSHEIRNPMNSILGMTQLLLETKPNQQQKNYLNILENSSHGLLEMLNNLLDFSTLESGKMKLENIKTDLYSVMEKSIDLVTTKVQEKNIEFVWEIYPDVPLRILSDPTRLQQVLVNLLSNAAKFTDQGHIMLKVSMINMPAGKRILISIVDSGIGIEQSKIESIFESFVQEHSSIRRKYGGTGLGLTIAKEIIGLMDGEIILETKKNVGSTFAVLIPFVSAGDDRKIGDFINHKLNGRRYMLIDKHDYSSQNIIDLVKDQGGQINRLKGLVDFSKMLRYIKKTDYEMILIDAATFGSDLEGFLDFMRNSGFDLNKICVLFRYIHTNYLFDLLNKYNIHHFFPKPIKPIEFINFLSGYVTQENMDHVKISQENDIFETSKRFKVLVAEDSADNRLLLKFYLEKYPVDLFFAEDGKKAVDLFDQQKFDIIFMDIQMPVMDGLTATKIIREKEKMRRVEPTPILAFSAHKPQEIFHENDDNLFTDFVLKPVTAQTVKNKLSQYLRFKHVDIRASNVKQKFNNNQLDVSDLIPSYLERRMQEIIQMRELYAKRDLKALGRIGHQLKGSAKSYGFSELGILGDSLEKVSQSENFQEIGDTIQKISKVILDYKDSNSIQ